MRQQRNRKTCYVSNGNGPLERQYLPAGKTGAILAATGGTPYSYSAGTDTIEGSVTIIEGIVDGAIRKLL